VRFVGEAERLVPAKIPARQLSIPGDDVEDADYRSAQLITYIGNKRALLNQILRAVDEVAHRLQRPKLRILDAMSGSGAVARALKSRAGYLATNDVEDYATVVSRCFLANRSAVPWDEVHALVEAFNQQATAATSDLGGLPSGMIERLYAPVDEANIGPTERVFYTRANARRLDVLCQALLVVAEPVRSLLLGPLLSSASVHANTAGVFKGFYKDRRTGRGRFGGTGADALTRILGPIKLALPVVSRFECDCEVFQEDAVQLVKRLHGLDLAYFDPPYNQHPYGSNYFMLNLICNYQEPADLSRVSGIPSDWRRSAFNVRAQFEQTFRDLIHGVDSRYILVSFNSEGFLSRETMAAILRERGRTEVVEIPYNTFRGSRNLRNRDIHVTEHLFLVECD